MCHAGEFFPVPPQLRSGGRTGKILPRDSCEREPGNSVHAEADAYRRHSRPCSYQEGLWLPSWASQHFLSWCPNPRVPQSPSSVEPDMGQSSPTDDQRFPDGALNPAVRLPRQESSRPDRSGLSGTFNSFKGLFLSAAFPAYTGPVRLLLLCPFGSKGKRPRELSSWPEFLRLSWDPESCPRTSLPTVQPCLLSLVLQPAPVERRSPFALALGV